MFDPAFFWIKLYASLFWFGAIFPEEESWLFYFYCVFFYFMFVVFEFGYLLGVLLNSFLCYGLNGCAEQRREYIWINLKTG